jgi:osmotically-inducible protein OsmY
MNRFLVIFLAFLPLLLQQTSALAAGPALTDAAIADQVRSKLAADPIVKGGAIGVSVNNGVVELTGSVQGQRVQARAEKITKKVKGVKQVINRLIVKTSESPGR